ncbi:phosphate-selective outer membrane channel [Citrifermentans bemidjiense Bem]|uniref:Phosphate-selective outer membrane channel n=1 Tax=Citrifermentans bemidjiense (strain ATCC BAA-1014 / DSM 16622 / JCM 12645 / Bem) TaxID=404380 RepID=B5EH99_CITBB|nr:porin [Citrifermentans bemidjiense]ACH39635.1 phosphate-selective outer membrane channel [Citrifermentans bemidjiense Bem]
MRRKYVLVAAVVTTLAGQEVGARTLEDVLKEKGVITEQDYKEVTKSKAQSYKIGKGFTLTSSEEKFQMSLGGRLQTRYTYTDGEDSSLTPNASRWEVRRMKLWINGYAYNKDLTYLLQVDFVSGGSSRLLEHAYLNYRFIDEVQLLAGQTKVPFGRQWLNSSGSQQFVDRSITSDTFRPGYDAGAKLGGDLFGGISTYEIGAYGGAGQSATRATNGDNTATAIAARVTVNPFGKMPYSESDLDDTATPLLSIGANYYGNTLRKTAATTFETNNITLAGTNGWLGRNVAAFATGELVDIDSYGADAAFKWRGVFALTEYLYGRGKGGDSGSIVRAHGWYAQAGYCIVPQTLEVALRYAFIDPNRAVSDDQRTDVSAAVSYYFNKHNLKIQGDVTNAHDQSKGSGVDDQIYRLQAQIIF